MANIVMSDSAHRQKILIVDDDPSLLEALERSFLEAGEDVVAHDSFEEARRVLQTTRFDALITDVRLGAFNGLQLAVIGRDTYPDMRLIVFSGFDDPVLRTEAEHVGATYMVKPVTGARLLEVLRESERNDGQEDKVKN
jgi:two-component system response regulator PilR (NtrC family)